MMQTSSQYYGQMITIILIMAGFMLGFTLSKLPEFMRKFRAGMSGMQLVKCIFLASGYKIKIRKLPVHNIGSKKGIFYRGGMYLVRDDACFYSSSTPTLIFREGNPLPVVAREGTKPVVSSTEVRSAIRSKVVEDLNAATQNKQIVQAMFFALLAFAVSIVAVILIWNLSQKVNILTQMVQQLGQLTQTALMAVLL